MKRLLLLLLTLAACEPKVLPTAEQYGCLYGKLKASDKYGELIRCSNREIAAAGDNQGAADKIAESLGIKYEDLSTMKKYARGTTKFVEKPDCNCRGTLEY